MITLFPNILHGSNMKFLLFHMQSSPVTLYPYPNSLILERRVYLKNAKDAESVIVMQIGEQVTVSLILGHWRLRGDEGPHLHTPNSVNHP